MSQTIRGRVSHLSIAPSRLGIVFAVTSDGAIAREKRSKFVGYSTKLSHKRTIVDKTTQSLRSSVWQIKYFRLDEVIDMDEFYVEKSANAEGTHVVHREGCPSLPALSDMHLIGVRSNTEAPLNEAANWFPKSAPCPECFPKK